MDLKTQETPPAGSDPFWRKKGIRRFVGPKRIVILAVFALCLAVLWYLRKKGLLTPEALFGFIGEHPVSAPVLFVLIYAVSIFFLIPTLPLNLGAGVLFGPIWGSVLASFGVWIGATAAFVLTRSALGQLLARRFDNALLNWLMNEMDTKGWKVLAFVRVNPIFPSGPLNFLFGLTPVAFTTYAWSTMVFQYPPTLAFAMIGHSAGTFLVTGEIQGLVRLVMIVSVALTLLWGGWFVSKRFLGKRDAGE